ncbi:MAG: outer membrane lipoprotein carrier protein LolA [Thermodesulfobacteriota bacterium]|nr:outer membrane lipoprotein carrier protein LolA [Thermodesulfobacteriota bacterium]
MRYTLLGFLFFFIALLNSSLWSGEITAHIQEQYEALQGFQADFVQSLKNAASGESETRTGRIFFKQPRLIRWETTTPERELLLAGKDVVWDYFQEEKTVYKYPASKVLGSKTMLRFLSGKARLERDFFVTNQGTEDGLTKLNLVPREPEPSLVQADVWLDPETYLLKKIMFIDFYGNENRLVLENLVLNPKLPKDLFEFVPPQDVEIMDNTGE